MIVGFDEITKEDFERLEYAIVQLDTRVRELEAAIYSLYDLQAQMADIQEIKEKLERVKNALY